MTNGRYHAHDGWYFHRNADATVTICADDSNGEPREVILQPGEWASIVASVSAEGETGETWRAALDVHGEPGPQTFIVNTRPVTMASSLVTYEEIANLANVAPERNPTVVYSRAGGVKTDGSLCAGESIMVTGRTIIDCMVTGSA